MLVEFLAKLPLKASVRFRCVDKNWYNLLLDSKHLESYLTRLSQGLLVQQLRYEKYSSFTVRDMYFIEHEDCNSWNDNYHVSVAKIGEKVQLPYFTPNLVTSCNGLVCLYENEKGVFHVSNPLTRESINFGIVRDEENILPDYYSPHLINHVIGFGVSNGSNQYKVLRIWKCEVKDHEDNIFLAYAGVEIYTVGDPYPTKFYSIHLKDINDSPGVFLNGVLHWLDISGRYIIRFDLQSEEFNEKKIFLPPSLEFGSNLGVSRGFLYVCELSDSIFDPDIGIWVMREFGNGEYWVRETVISNLLETWSSTSTKRDFEIIKISEDWTKVLLLCDLQLFWYNSADRSFSKAETTGLEYICHAIPYVPSFISPLELATSHEVVGMKNDQRSKAAVEEL
ncbi:hypothetical protein ACFE04_030657 [Oxalis oulophora]